MHDRGWHSRHIKEFETCHELVNQDLQGLEGGVAGHSGVDLKWVKAHHDIEVVGGPHRHNIRRYSVGTEDQDKTARYYVAVEYKRGGWK